MTAPRPAAVTVVAAALLAAAMVVVAVLAARALGERDQAVRRGVLLQLGHELEAELRDAGPEAASATVEAFLAAHAGEVSGIELAGPAGVVAAAGEVSSRAQEVLVTGLGRDWRTAFGAGPGMGRGPGGRGPGALRLRLEPSAGLGRASLLARAVTAGSVVTAVALVGLALLGVAGMRKGERLQAAEAERRRLEVVSLAGAGLAHRIRNPLGAIKGTAQLMAASDGGATPERARRIVEASERIDALLGQLLQFARPAEPVPVRVDLAEVARRAAGRTAGTVRVEGATPAPATTDEEHAESIVEELLANARAFDPDGELEVVVAATPARATVEVRDRGPGLDVGVDRAFDPYVTTRSEGTGLGLAIVRALAEANDGSVTLEPRPGGGTVARLELPGAR